jgi:hypothetical protein
MSTIIPSVILAAPLGTDSAAMCTGIGAADRLTLRRRLTIAGTLTAFEAGMPVVGVLLAGVVGGTLGDYARWIGGALLALLGVHMLRVRQRFRDRSGAHRRPGATARRTRRVGGRDCRRCVTRARRGQCAGPGLDDRRRCVLGDDGRLDLGWSPVTARRTRRPARRLCAHSAWCTARGWGPLMAARPEGDPVRRQDHRRLMARRWLCRTGRAPYASERAAHVVRTRRDGRARLRRD